jgi:transposase InsO family protein
MGSILHGNAKTTPRVRKEIQESKESLATLAKRYGVNEKTVLYWKHAGTTEDKKCGPKTRKSALSELEQQAICSVRRHLKLPLDDLLIVFKDRIPALTRSNLHRCLQHHGLSKLPAEASDKTSQPFKKYNIGYVHVDITELRCETGKWYLFVAIDRLTKYVYVELHPRMTQEVAVQFLRNLQDACVFKITHILTDNGAQFTYNLLASHLQPNKKHAFTTLCEELGIEHRTTQFRHPWTNGQVEITNKIIKQATTKQFHYETPDDLKVHLQTFILYYNHQRPLKSLKLKTPWQLVQECYNQNPELFKSNPHDKIVGLNR